MGYQICYENWKNTFSIPCDVTDRFLSDCGAVQLKVLLLVLRHQDQSISSEKIAQALSLPSADIRDALNYWVSAGILTRDMEQAAAQKTLLASLEEKPKPLTEQPPKPTETATDKALSTMGKPSPARMTASEIHEMTKRQPVIRSLLHETEAILGKTLTSTDISTVISLYDWAGIPADVILMVVAYCASIDKRNLRYIEKTALSWQEMGLDNDKAIEEYLDRQSVLRKREQEVQSAFGIYDRRLTSKEQKYIDQWYSDYQFSVDMIRLAYEKTVDNTGKISFPYIHKILSSWHEKGFKTPEEALTESAPGKSSIEKQKEYSFDLEEFERQHRWHVPTID